MVEKKKHRKRSASKISRLIRCPGSEDFVRYLIRKNLIPEESSSKYASEGTMLHAEMENRFFHRPYTNDLDNEQVSCLDACMEFFLELQVKHGFTWAQVEREVDLIKFGLEDTGGTADIIAGQERRSLHIVDWKFGRGVPVSVKKNEQLMTYLIGAAEDLDSLKAYEELWIHIAQPRLDYFDSYQCDVNEAMGLVNVMKNAFARHDIIAGEIQCQWCPGKAYGLCNEYNEYVAKNASAVFGLTVQAPKDLVNIEETFEFNISSIKKAVAILEKEALLKKVFKAAKDMIQVLPSGQLAELGLKRVAGRSNRTWVSPEQVVKYLCKNYEDIEDIYEPPVLKSPAKMEAAIKGLKKDPEFKKLIHKPLGAPTIVSLSDPRPEYQIDPAEVFKGLDQDRDFEE